MIVESRQLGQIDMILSQKKRWLQSKYSIPISVWQTQLIESVNCIDDDNKPKRIEYQYKKEQLGFLEKYER